MKIQLLLSLLFVIYLTVAVAKKRKDGMPSFLRFQHTRYVFKMKENHGIGHTRFQVKAQGCGSKGVRYSIQRTRVPFTVHPNTGKISLTERLNYEQKELHTFIVEAVANNKHCQGGKAITLVTVNVTQFNKYRPQFEADKYYCRIQEESGHVKVSPLIKVSDSDTGPAGKISEVQVRESQEPFVVELEESTGIVTVKATRGYKFDAGRMSSYKFSLQAWDGGEPPRNSPPVKLKCLVVPQNRHAPVFKEKMYVGRVKQGETKSKIVKVLAKDSDTYERLGDICEYFIRTSDMPFSINNKGVISLAKPLGKDAPDTYVFTVMAKDCGGRISEEATTVNIIVDKDCTPGFVEQENKTPLLKDCEGMVRLTPKARLDMCGESRQYATFSARVTMETAHILKGCDRETYEASAVFKMCNVNKTIDLLPSGNAGTNWMAGVLNDDNIIGESVYHFDNSTAVVVPSYVMEYTGDENMTLSTWVWMQKQDRVQYIIAATDPQRLDRKHFGLYTEGDRLVFIHRQETNTGSEKICQSVFVWKPEIFNKQWHHVLVTVNGCKAAKLYVNSKEVAVSNVKEHWPLHGTNMANRVVIGARWSGKEQAYKDYFDGYLAGMSVNFGELIEQQAIKCVYECKEHIKIDSPAPDGFQVKQNGHNVIEINGQGSPETFENILRGLVYVNTRRSPTNGRRPLQIHTMINKQPLPMLNLDIVVSSGEKTVLKLSGGSRKVVELNDLKKYGIRIAEKLTITSDKCSKYLDSARVEVEPPLSSEESLVNPGPLLDLFNLRKENLPEGKGVIIRGLATIDEYKRVLREMVFVHLGLEGVHPSALVFHNFKFTVSNLKNRYVSNILQTELTTEKRQQFGMQRSGGQEEGMLPGPVVDDEKDILPGAVGERDDTARSSSLSFTVMVGVTVAASCLFVLAILVVVIRMQRTRTVYLNVPQKEGETAGQDDCSEQERMNVTINPLEKFDTVGVEAGCEETSNPSGGKTLEWDDAYIA